MTKTGGYDSRIERMGQAFFYLGLAFELLIVILDKSSWINPVEGQMFRVTFLFFALKVCCTKYSAREWGAVFLAGAVAAVCYLISTRDEAVRAVVFVVSMKGIDHKKAMKLTFWGTIAGLLVLAGLAFAGVLGEVVDAGAGYGFKAAIPRLCLGVGNSNALACMIWALMTLGIYLYHERMRLPHFLLLLLLCAAVYAATVTRTALLVMLVTVAGAALMRYSKKLRESKWVYGGGIVLVLLEVAFSMYAAHISTWYDFLEDWQIKLDRVLTGRIVSIYAFENGGGVLENWKLFGDPDYIEYFDMGYVRLFFWYGIVPGSCAILLVCLLIWQCRKQRDAFGYVLVMSFALYALTEAHAVSVYLARNYVLLLMGAYWTAMLPGNARGRTAYWWRFWTLFASGGKNR